MQSNKPSCERHRDQGDPGDKGKHMGRCPHTWAAWKPLKPPLTLSAVKTFIVQDRKTAYRSYRSPEWRHTRLFQIERLVALLSAFAHPFKLAPGCAGTRKAGGQQIWLMMIAAFCDEQAGRFRGNVIGCGDRRCDSSR